MSQELKVDMRGALQRLCAQGTQGPAIVNTVLARELERRGFIEQIGENTWLPTESGRRWCNAHDDTPLPGADNGNDITLGSGPAATPPGSGPK